MAAHGVNGRWGYTQLTPRYAQISQFIWSGRHTKYLVKDDSQQISIIGSLIETNEIIFLCNVYISSKVYLK